jgi:hypothetical protein
LEGCFLKIGRLRLSESDKKTNMARNGIKSGGRDIKPGEVLNPHGGPKLSPDARKFKKLTLEEYVTLIHKVLKMNLEDMDKVLQDPKATCLEKYVVNIAKIGGTGGDTSRLSFLLERLIGKVTEKIDLSSKDRSMSPNRIDLSKLSTAELETLLALQHKAERE